MRIRSSSAPFFSCFRGAGHDVLLLPGPQEALDELAHGNAYDVVIIDRGTAEMSAVRFAQTVRDRHRMAAPSLVLMVDDGDELGEAGPAGDLFFRIARRSIDPLDLLVAVDAAAARSTVGHQRSGVRLRYLIRTRASGALGKHSTDD